MAEGSDSQNGTDTPHSYGEQNFIPVGQHVDHSAQQANGELDQRMVEEIESLCMNCHEDVRYYYANLYPPRPLLILKIRASPVSS